MLVLSFLSFLSFLSIFFSMAGRGRGLPAVQALPAQPTGAAFDAERFRDEDCQQAYLETWRSRAHPLERKMTLSDFSCHAP